MRLVTDLRTGAVVVKLVRLVTLVRADLAGAATDLRVAAMLRRAATRAMLLRASSFLLNTIGEMTVLLRGAGTPDLRAATLWRFFRSETTDLRAAFENNKNQIGLLIFSIFINNLIEYKK